MCGLSPKAGLELDGVSFVPALKGSGPGRDTLFCHFPHLNGNPADDPKTGAYLRQGDWKLIRRFCANEDQTDRYELFNLRDDQGEANDLAASMPQKVRELQDKLDEFFKSTGAVLPKPNPAYVRADRWSAGAQAAAVLHDSKMAVESAKDRPTLQIRKVVGGSGTFVVKFRMRASSGRNGLVLWGTDLDPGFSSERRAAFTPTFDGRWHDYDVRFTTSATLRQLRIDGSLQPTKLEYEWIRVCREDGTLVQSWDFNSSE
jgi:hypothetical protein